jgi:uncharacterized protein YndB with AHSA1/START domain
MKSNFHFNPNLDLTFSRHVPINQKLMWRAWTEPALLMQWFCPKPWKTTQCEIDLRVGGKFITIMESPDGIKISNEGCYLEVETFEKLTWTNAFSEGFRPQSSGHKLNDAGPNFSFTAIIQFQSLGEETLYTATVLHADETCRQNHVDMGFEAGWSIALDQMVAMIKNGI